MRGKPEIPKKSRFRNIILNLAFFLIIFFAFIGALEVLLRTTHLFGAGISCSKPDSILGWRFTPGKKYWYKEENERAITGRINIYGWRDKDWSLTKPQNTYRIAVLGDSFVEAFQVETESTFLAIAERQLNKSQTLKAELMNFGRSGFTQTEELLVLKNEIIQFFPDMVVLFFLPGNDISDISRQTTVNLQRPFYHILENGELILDKSFSKTREFKIRCFFNWIKQNSALFSIIIKRYNAYRIQKAERKRSEEKGTKSLFGSLSLCTANPDPRYLNSYRLNKILIKIISEYCKNKGIRFMLVTIDISAYIPQVEDEIKSIDSTFNSNFFEDDLKSYSKLIDIDYLGLQRIFRQYYKNTGTSLHWGHFPGGYWGHWNYQGHKVVADALSKELKTITNSEEEN